jgi:hypothetical protein
LKEIAIYRKDDAKTLSLDKLDVAIAEKALKKALAAKH